MPWENLKRIWCCLCLTTRWNSKASEFVFFMICYVYIYILYILYIYTYQPLVYILTQKEKTRTKLILTGRSLLVQPCNSPNMRSTPPKDPGFHTGSKAKDGCANGPAVCGIPSNFWCLQNDLSTTWGENQPKPVPWFSETLFLLWISS